MQSETSCPCYICSVMEKSRTSGKVQGQETFFFSFFFNRQCLHALVYNNRKDNAHNMNNTWVSLKLIFKCVCFIKKVMNC